LIWQAVTLMIPSEGGGTDTCFGGALAVASMVTSVGGGYNFGFHGGINDCLGK